jgi:glycerol-3-phosphate dehydrogenase
MNKTQNLARLQTETFDVCIIGGGASGAGVALDAALRGLKVALIEKNDFASETSAKSTKLIHGGVRYLEQAFKNLDFAQLRQVRHGLEERHILLNNAPHLAHPLALVTPVFSWFEGLYFTIGLKIYGFFAKNDTLPKAAWLTKKETFAHIPTLTPRLHSSVMYYDGQLDDARYCLALVQSASEAGAVVVNYTEVIDFERDTNQRIISLRAKNTLVDDPIFTVKAKLFINCTGPFADSIRLMANSKLEKIIRPSKGVHLMLPPEVFKSNDALLIPKTKDGRVVFVIPFEGAVMVGTTDDPYTALHQEPILETDEIEFLLDTLRPYLAKTPDRQQIKAGFGGLRPLIAFSQSKETKKLVRDHEVEYDETSGLLSLLGGKWTTYRLMAKDTVDKAAQLLQNSAPCTTQQHLLAGAAGYQFENWQHLQYKYRLDDDICKHLSQKYGSRAERVVADVVIEDLERILPNYPFIKAEVRYAVRHEMACVPRDFLARRIRLELTHWQDTKAATAIVAQLMAQELHWTDTQKAAHIEEYIQLLNKKQTTAGL